MRKNRTVLVTGGAGFLGCHLSKNLNERGFDVIALGRRKFSDLSQYAKKYLKSVDYVSFDLNKISSESNLNKIFNIKNNLEVVCHLAWSGEDSLSDLNVSAQLKNINISTTLYQAAANNGVKKFIFAGTMEENFAEAYTMLNFEDNTFNNRHVVYALAKNGARNALKQMSNSFDCDLMCITNSHIIGPNDPKDSFLQFVILEFMKGRNLKMTKGNQIFDVIDVEDCADFYAEVIERGQKRKDYWAGSGSPQPLKNYVEQIKNIIFPQAEIHFGAVPYNDVVLSVEDFDFSHNLDVSQSKLRHSFSSSVRRLHEHLKASS